MTDVSRHRLLTGAVWCLAILWAIFIFFMSAHSGSDLNDGTDLVSTIKRWLDEWQTRAFGPDVDVVSSAAHFCEYTVFGILLACAFSRHFDTPLRVFLGAIAVASLYAVTDEVHQLFVPERMCDPLDWLVDTAGAALGAALVLLVMRTWRRRAAAHRD